jgi:hypothetical protein
MTKTNWTLFQTKYLVRKIVYKSTTVLLMSFACFTCHLFYGIYKLKTTLLKCTQTHCKL